MGAGAADSDDDDEEEEEEEDGDGGAGGSKGKGKGKGADVGDGEAQGEAAGDSGRRRARGVPRASRTGAVASHPSLTRASPSPTALPQGLSLSPWALPSPTPFPQGPSLIPWDSPSPAPLSLGRSPSPFYLTLYLTLAPPTGPLPHPFALPHDRGNHVCGLPQRRLAKVGATDDHL